ncbi:MAG: ThiF family adenylyltransferase [Aigarchaeota archaeon]|nr:ThiF family adenylyltransferase [Aigarchaeota archaeon]
MTNECEKELMERYDRQLRIAGWNQAKLMEATVMVAGVGAIGCEVAKNLALMGVGKLILVDNDVVELSNLSRQMLFTDEDLGKSKAVVAAEKLRKMNPCIKVDAYFEDVRRLDQSIFQETRVIVSCLDNWPVRRWLNSLAIELNKVLVDSSMDGFYANLQVVIPKETPCLECHGDDLIPKEIQIAECTLRKKTPKDLIEELKGYGIEIGLKTAEKLFMLNIKTAYDIKYAQASLLEKLDGKVRKEVQELQEKLKPRMPALQCVAALISGIASTEVIKILHEGTLGEIIKDLLVYDGLSNSFTFVHLERRGDCFVCGDAVREEAVPFPLRLSETILELKKRIAEKFSIPDPELLYKRWRLSDEQKLADLSPQAGDVIYVDTSRRFMPLPLRIEIMEE